MRMMKTMVEMETAMMMTAAMTAKMRMDQGTIRG
jgi:hypothetical protein